MITVPTLSGNLPQQSGPPSAYLGASAAPVGQLLGEGVSAIGGALKNAEEKRAAEKKSAYAQMLKVQEAANRGIARERMAQFRDALITDTYGDENGEGGWWDAEGDAMRTALQERPAAWEEKWRELGSDLNPEAREYFDEDAQAEMLQMRERLKGRALGAIAAQNEASYKNETIGIRTSHTAFVSEGGVSLRPSKNATGKRPVMELVDPALEHTLAETDKNIDEFLAENGHRSVLPIEEQRAVMREEAHGLIHTEAIEALLGDSKDQEADAYMRWAIEHDDFKGPDKERLDPQVKDAHDTGEASRWAQDLWGKHIRGEGTLSERVGRMKTDARDASVPEDVRDMVPGAIDKMESAERARIERENGDAQMAIMEALDTGAKTPTDALVSASVLPVDHRAAVARKVDQMAGDLIVHEQNDFYWEWMTKASGRNPETGELDPKMREEFIQHNFEPDMLLATEANWNFLRARQKEFTEQSPAAAKAMKSMITDDEIADRMVRIMYPELEGDERTNQLYDLKRNLDAFWADEQGEGPELTPAQKQKSADILMGLTSFDRWGAGRGPGGTSSDLRVIDVLAADPTILDVSDLDDEIRATVIRELREIGIENPSDAQIIKQYQNALARGVREDVRGK